MQHWSRFIAYSNRVQLVRIEMSSLQRYCIETGVCIYLLLISKVVLMRCKVALNHCFTPNYTAKQVCLLSLDCGLPSFWNMLLFPTPMSQLLQVTTNIPKFSIFFNCFSNIFFSGIKCLKLTFCINHQSTEYSPHCRVNWPILIYYLKYLPLWYFSPLSICWWMFRSYSFDHKYSFILFG